MNTKHLAQNMFEIHRDELCEDDRDWTDLSKDEREAWRTVAEFAQDELVNEGNDSGAYLDDEEPGSLFDSKTHGDY